MNKVIALINAGGVGSRFNSDIPKQYMSLNNKPIILYCLELFQLNENIDEIYCVCDKKYFHLIETICKEHNINKFVNNIQCGSTANESRFNGIKHLINKINNDDIIIMHDAVRILTKNETINKIVINAINHNIAVCGQTINANIFVNVNDKVYYDDTIPSNGIFINSMPFGCKYKILKDSFDAAFLNGDISNSAGPMGIVAKYYNINSFNKIEIDFIETLKITYKEDIKIIENLL